MSDEAAEKKAVALASFSYALYIDAKLMDSLKNADLAIQFLELAVAEGKHVEIQTANSGVYRQGCGICGSEDWVLDLRSKVADVRQLFREVAEGEDEGWILMKESSDGTKTWFRKETYDSAISCKMEGFVDAPLFNLMALVYELDLYPSWVPLILGYGLTEMNTYHVYNEFWKSAVMYVTLPYPLSGRESVIAGYGCNLLEYEDEPDLNGNLAIVFKSPLSDDDEYGAKNPDDPFYCYTAGVSPPRKRSGFVRSMIEFGGAILSPLSPTKSKVIIQMRIELFLTIIPQWLIDWGTKKVFHVAFQILKEKAQDLKGTEHEKKIESNQAVYGHIRAIIDGYFSRANRLEA